MSNFYQAISSQGVFLGGVMLQASSRIGGARSVFVPIDGVNNLVLPTWGGQLKNPFKNAPAKIYAGDLFELRLDEKGESPELYLLKTFKVKELSDTTLKLYRDGYSHVPCVGDVIMKEPSTMDGTGIAKTIQSVVAGNEGGTDIWTVTLDATIDSCSDGDILVEAESAGASQKMLIKTINAVAPCDYDMPFVPSVGTTESFDAARYLITPVFHGVMYKHKMSYLPKCVEPLNKSRMNGWFEV